MRNPNGFGSVYKMSGKRRNPWRATVTKGWDVKDGKAVQERATLGYYKTRQDAMSALYEYNKNPFDLDSDMTFAEVYDLWSALHYKKITEASAKQMISAFKHLEPLHLMPVRHIKTFHVESVINSINLGDSVKGRVHALANMVFKHAMKLELIEKNPATLVEIIHEAEARQIHTPFLVEEIKAIGSMEGDVRDFIVVGIYSGWRPQELMNLTLEDVDLEEMTMRGGIKTKAGKNRIVPIHSAIVPTLERLCGNTDDYLFKKKSGAQMTHYSLRRMWDKFDTEHLPHDVRHTFATLGKEYDIDEYCLKLMLGHAITDITEKVYTHRKIERLKTEIEKIPDFIN